jgi:hypothetical protein
MLGLIFIFFVCIVIIRLILEALSLLEWLLFPKKRKDNDK